MDMEYVIMHLNRGKGADTLLLAFCAFFIPMLAAFVEILTHSHGNILEVATNLTHIE